MTAQHSARPVAFSRTAMFVLIAAVAVAAAFAAGRYERDRGGAASEPLTSTGSALTPSISAPAVLGESDIIAEHEAQIEGVLGQPRSPVIGSSGITETEVLAQHAAEINVVLGVPPFDSGTREPAQSEAEVIAQHGNQINGGLRPDVAAPEPSPVP